ncbi:SDA1-domain-containing protein [Paraphoma chrysanthemicola]|uniref:Protein SDA1 n=1 Tax=Paraphoma chrysanthemicola TaxID=798071 RepID=A0A8K0R166_9PLEO|nr:SDA1-domain-containing protein [Paraphoma chrysanthemicola]
MKRKVGALEKIEADHAALRYKLKRDPQSYRDDFNNQYQQYETLRDLFLQNPSSTDSGLVALKDLIEFISHVADRYPDLTSKFPEDLTQILLLHHEVLEYELRDKIVGSIVLLRNKDVIDSAVLLNTLFPILVSTPSKSLRQLLFTKILSDLRSSNSKTANHKLNRTIQTVLYNLLESDKESPKGIWAVKITRELWKRQIWTDARAVEVMRMAALSDNEKVITGGVRFFLGGDREREEAAEESDDDEDVDIARLRHQVGINKKSKKNQRDLKKAAATVKKKEKKKNAPHPLNFSALHLLHDPQGFAESLFSKHVQNSKSKLQHESKLLILQLVSRLVGLHKLTVLSLYSFFLKHLTPRQESVTSYLACLAQATHNYVPPDVLEPLVQKIANEFVSEASASEVAAAGLNAIREICARQPLAMTDTLLQDLVQYRKSKDKGTMMAAKGLLSLYREVGADLLHKRDRGKDAAMGIRAGTIKERRYGEEAVGEIEGIELLEKWKEEERRKKRVEAGLDPDADDGDEALDEGEDWKNWDVESDEDSDDSGGWINVESDGEDIQISDSEDEKDKSKTKQPPNKKRKMSSATPGPTDASAEKENTKSIEPESKPLSKLLTTTILTPADLKQLRALQEANAISSALPSHKRAQLLAQRHADEAITAETIELAASIGKKNTKEEKIAMAKGDRETNHQSTTAKRKEKKVAEGKSTTNKEKARKKNFLMTLGKAKSKNKRSLTDVKRTLQGHIDRSKRGGKRGNKGH